VTAPTPCTLSHPFGGWGLAAPALHSPCVAGSTHRNGSHQWRKFVETEIRLSRLAATTIGAHVGVGVRRRAPVLDGRVRASADRASFGAHVRWPAPYSDQLRRRPSSTNETEAGIMIEDSARSRTLLAAPRDLCPCLTSISAFSRQAPAQQLQVAARRRRDTARRSRTASRNTW
jgi:hypothetical protein